MRCKYIELVNQAEIYADKALFHSINHCAVFRVCGQSIDRQNMANLVAKDLLGQPGHAI
jgi:hypothetical protein